MKTSRLALLALGLLSALAPASATAQPAPPPAPGAAPKAPPALVPPKLIESTDIPYPRGGSGDAAVLLVIVVNPDGTVRSAKAAMGEEPFASAAIEGARSFRFQPATRDGVPVAATIRMEIRFQEPAPEPAPEEPPVAPPTGSSPSPPGAPGAPAPPAGAAGPQPPEPAEKPGEAVTIRGQRSEPGRTVSLTRAEVRQIPGAFGDPFRAIEILPGVTPIVSGLPFFYIRGAPPGNVGYFLDGIRVPLLYHIGVGPSVIHPGLIDRVDLYPGGYPARFGRFAGGIVAGETAPPRPEWHGEGNVRLFDAGALVEAPFDEGRGTAMVGGRYSYTAALLSAFAPTVALDYWDYQARVAYNVTPDDRVTVFGFGSYDFLGSKENGVTSTVFGTEFHRVDMRYDHALGDRGTVRTAVMLGLDRTRMGEDRYLRDRLVGVRGELTYQLAPGALLRAGTDANLDTYDVVFGQSQNPQTTATLSSIFPTRQDIALGARADVVLQVTPELEVIPGVRTDFYGSQGATAVALDPRIAARLALSDHVRLLEAAGVAHQVPSFVIPVPGFQPGGLRGGLQTALQESFGVEADVDDATVATATVFHNAFFNMSDALSSEPRTVSGCPPGSFPEETLPGDPGGQTGRRGCINSRFKEGQVGTDGGRGGGGDSQVAKTFETRALGSAYGLELMLKRKLTRRVGGFFSYTLSRSVRSVGNQTFIASFDRTHVANAALAFDLGRSWRAGTRLMFYTGLPAAPDPTNPDASSRLPSFYRLDLRLEKRWTLGKDAWVSFIAEWMNATLQKEAVSTTCTLQGCQSQTIGPVTIPSLGVEGGF